MKFLIPLFILFQTHLAIGQNYSYEYIDQTAASNFRAVFFASEEVGYASSYSGALIKTTDSGATWTATSLTTEHPIQGIHFIDDNYGFAVGGDAGCSPSPCDVPGSLIFKTTDGGATWAETQLDNRELYSVYFMDANVGFTVGLGNLFRTTDGGANWTSIDLGEFYNIRKIQFIGATGYASCLFGKMLKSTDSGVTWEALNTGVTSHLYAFDFVDENTVFAAGQNEFIKTTDGGATWQVIPDAPTEIYSLTTFSADFLIASGRGIYTGGDFGTFLGGLYFSTDSGATWAAKDSLEITSIAYSNFYSEDLGFAVGQGFEILKLSVEDMTNPTQEIAMQKEQSVYPNPVASILYLEGSVNQSDTHISILNSNGQLLLKQNDVSSGVDVSELKSGVYIYQISQNNKLIHGKFIKL